MWLGLLPLSVTHSKKVLTFKERMRSLMFIVKMSMALVYAIVSLAFIISFLFTRTISFISWVNTVFIISLLVLLAGCIMIVIQGGFFDRFIVNFKHFWRKNDKAEEVVREVEGKETQDQTTRTKVGSIHVSAKIMLVSGGCLVLLSIILSYSLS